MMLFNPKELFLNGWLLELQSLVAKADGQGIREDIPSMMLEDLHGLYLFLKRSQAF